MAKRISRAQARAAGFKSATEAIGLLGSDARAIARQLEKNELMFDSNWGFGNSGVAPRERVITLDDLKAAYQAGFKAGQLQTMTKTQFREALQKHYAKTTPANYQVSKLSNTEKNKAIRALYSKGKILGNLENYVTFLNENYEEIEEVENLNVVDELSLEDTISFF